jgi:hypothetical protein
LYWRKGWDSNPRYPCRYAGFQDRCLKPLGHPSKPLKWLAYISPQTATKTSFATALLPNFLRALVYGCSHRVVNGACRLALNVRHEVRVDVHRDGDRGMAEPFLDDLGVNVRRKQVAGMARRKPCKVTPWPSDRRKPETRRVSCRGRTGEPSGSV